MVDVQCVRKQPLQAEPDFLPGAWHFHVEIWGAMQAAVEYVGVYQEDPSALTESGFPMLYNLQTLSGTALTTERSTVSVLSTPD